MNITDVRLRKLNGDGKTKAAASITIDDDFVVHDIRVVEGQGGLCVACYYSRAAPGDPALPAFLSS